MTAPVLFLGWGNPSRGDDALGPLLCARLFGLIENSPALAARVEVAEDFQLQVEDAADIVGRELVVFIDASLDATPPYHFSRVEALADASVSSHALSPAAVVDVACRIFGATPLCYQLAVRGERFELGEALSPPARDALEAAWTALRAIAEAENPVAAAALLARAASRPPA